MKTRLCKVLFAAAAIVALLFAQAVLAAHACDSLRPACHGTGDAIVACAQHCAAAQVNVDSVVPGTLSPPAAASLRVEPAAPRAMPVRADPALRHATSAPIAIRYCRLRD